MTTTESEFVVIFADKLLYLKAVRKDACRNFARYKGVKAPSCGCLPCVEKYLAQCEKKGLKVVR